MAKKKTVKQPFEQDYDHTNEISEWRKPQGLYLNDINAKEKLNAFFITAIKISEAVSFILILFIFFGLLAFVFFTNFETVYLSDGSQLGCVVNSDGTTTLVY